MSTSAHPYLMMALNNAWANATLHAALDALPAGAFTAPRPGFFPSLCLTLNHIHDVDLYYLDALEEGGLGRSVYEGGTIEDPLVLAEAQSEIDLRLARFCQTLSPELLAARRITDRSSGPVEERVDMLLLHLFQHQIHHRGQAHVQLQDAGVVPPQLDEFYLDYDRAPTAEHYH